MGWTGLSVALVWTGEQSIDPPSATVARSLLPISANRTHQHLGRAAPTSQRSTLASPSLHHSLILRANNSARDCSRPSLTRHSPPRAPFDQQDTSFPENDHSF